MHYVKQFNINGVDTKQVACIELQGVPNAATEGAVGVLGMDMTSPTHEVYRCVAVQGSIYTWELLSAGMSIVSATITGEGGISKEFPYSTLLVPNGYLIKSGDLILDSEGYLYQIGSIGVDSCNASYCGTHIGGNASGGKDYRLVVTEGKLKLVTENGNVVSETNYLLSDEDTIHRDPTTGKVCVIGIKTINGTILRLFVGEQEIYNKLTDAQKQGVFAIITDDNTKEEIYKAIDNTFKLVGGEKITSGNLDDYYQVGNYYIEGVVDAPNVSNMPIKTAGVLKVISGNGTPFNDNSEWFCIIQMFIAHSTGDMYVRGMIHNETGNHWQPWQQIGWFGKTPNKGGSPNEASLVFTNTNGFGNENSSLNGFWRVWNYGNETDGYYCYLVPSIDNKQSIGLPGKKVKEAYIEQVHGKADYAEHADFADRADGLVPVSKTIEIPSGSNGIDITLELNSIYVFRDVNSYFTYTLYIGNTHYAESNISRSNINHYLSYSNKRLYMRKSDGTNSSNDVVLSYVKLATAIPQF